LVGINHIAPEVGDVAAALDFYGSIFTFELRGSRRDDGNRVTMAFLDMGGQFFGVRRVFPNKAVRAASSAMNRIMAGYRTEARSLRAWPGSSLSGWTAILMRRKMALAECVPIRGRLCAVGCPFPGDWTLAQYNLF
jgi:hypothetical protein